MILVDFVIGSWAASLRPEAMWTCLGTGSRLLWQPACWPWQEHPDASWENTSLKKKKPDSRSLTETNASVERTVVILNV